MTRRCALWLSLLSLSGCSFDKSEHADFCQHDRDCSGTEQCVAGFCVMGGGASGSDDAASGADGSSQGEPCVETGVAEPCYDGAAGTADVGICKRGERLCVGGTFTQCLGQVEPAAEDCNGVDDDCDGTTDEIDEPQCPAAMHGVCREGELTCRGSFAVCEALRVPDNEQCNGADDDCDGEIDEVPGSMCYPQADGCMMGESGVTCLGLCRTGTARCQAGAEMCEGAVLPEQEQCTSEEGAPADEDCDGAVDESCPCSDEQTRSCYAGPPGTRDKGTCRAGTQHCVDQQWGACEGQVLPLTETCHNTGQDDNCNGTVDDIEGLGDPCIASQQQGLCRSGTQQCSGNETLPVCVGAEPEAEQCDPRDHNCDGDPYDGIDFTSNETCGDCKTQCSDAQMCCSGACRSPSFFAENDAHCGACNNRCGASEVCCQGDCVRTRGILAPILLGGEGEPDMCQCEEPCEEGEVCCFDTCVDLDNDPENCGFCGNRCESSDEDANEGESRKALCREGACVSP